MTGMHALWIPIVVSAVFVFIASSVIHMMLPWHKDDYARLPDEDAVLNALRPFNLPPGDYMMPRPASSADMSSPEFKAKMDKGPVAVFTVRPNGPWNMGKTMGSWFVYSLVISFVAAYVAGRANPVGANYLHVFRFAGVTAFLGYSAALWQMQIWYGRSTTTTIKSTIDGLIYACLTAGVFGWLWPH
jgi:hypothetical protein